MGKESRSAKVAYTLLRVFEMLDLEFIMQALKNNNPKISIVTPCYNSEKFIHRLHVSLCAQSYKNFEWVLVDDCSSDNTVEVIKALIPPGEGGISLYKMPQNSGGGIATGFGVEKCRGEICFIIDHDDELIPSALNTVVNDWAKVIMRPEIAGIFYRRFNPDIGQVIGEELLPDTEFSMSWLSNTKPSITDGFLAFKNFAIKKYFSPKSLEFICLFGVPLSLMTKEYKFIAGRSVPLLIYHRDNAESQTNSIKISKKTVYTYAKYIDAYDVYYFKRPLFWARHVIALIKFSITVYHNPIHHHRFIGSRMVRIFSFFLVPIGVFSYLYFGSRVAVIDFPDFNLDKLCTLQDVY